MNKWITNTCLKDLKLGLFVQSQLRNKHVLPGTNFFNMFKNSMLLSVVDGKNLYKNACWKK